MRLFAYKVVRDYGFAPNPFQGFCTLATCKPNIRKSAKEGDLVIGCGTVKRLVGRAMFAMRVTDRISFDEYWADPRFSKKRPSLVSSLSRAYGDNIYHHDGDGNWIQEDSHHSLIGGGLNQANLERDTSADVVLASDEFTYWGENAVLPPTCLGAISLPRDYHVNFPAGVVDEVNNWFEALPRRGVLGMPADL